MTIQLDQKKLIEQPELLARFIQAVQLDVTFLRASYPNFDEWFFSKVIPGLLNGERTVILEQRESRVVGLLILKHNEDERKLCTLRVRPEYESRGVGIKLFEKAFETLETSEPLLSVSEIALPKFRRIFRHFGFTLEKSYLGIYLPSVQEHSFNGLLVPEIEHNIVKSDRRDEDARGEEGKFIYERDLKLNRVENDKKF